MLTINSDYFCSPMTSGGIYSRACAADGACDAITAVGKFCELCAEDLCNSANGFAPVIILVAATIIAAVATLL